VNGVFQPLPPVLLRDIGNQSTLRGVYRRFSGHSEAFTDVSPSKMLVNEDPLDLHWIMNVR
jgi:hypothetical protein